MFKQIILKSFTILFSYGVGSVQENAKHREPCGIESASKRIKHL
jgi:hypothetical protein